jgi:hypothetical protein
VSAYVLGITGRPCSGKSWLAAQLGGVLLKLNRGLSSAEVQAMRADVAAQTGAGTDTIDRWFRDSDPALYRVMRAHGRAAGPWFALGLRRQIEAQPASHYVFPYSELYRFGLEAACSAVVYVDTPDVARWARGAESRGWSRERFAFLDGLYEPESERARSQLVVGDSSEVERVLTFLRAQVS